MRTSLGKNRKKYETLTARPVATIFSVSPSNPFHTLEVRGTAAVLDDDTERTFMTRLSRRTERHCSRWPNRPLKSGSWSRCTRPGSARKAEADA